MTSLTGERLSRSLRTASRILIFLAIGLFPMWANAIPQEIWTQQEMFSASNAVLLVAERPQVISSSMFGAVDVRALDLALKGVPFEIHHYVTIQIFKGDPFLNENDHNLSFNFKHVGVSSVALGNVDCTLPGISVDEAAPFSKQILFLSNERDSNGDLIALWVVPATEDSLEIVRLAASMEDSEKPCCGVIRNDTKELRGD
jgi:hypothetical protein